MSDAEHWALVMVFTSTCADKIFRKDIKKCSYFLQDVWLIAPRLECAPASDRGHLVVIVGGGGGEADGADPVTEAHGAGQLDDGKVIVKCICDIVWMVNELAELSELDKMNIFNSCFSPWSDGLFSITS